jgi:uncharacterized membrane protein YgdD (TMEM256/DUF423 family)
MISAMTERLLVILAALNMMIAVGAGAFGAHGLKNVLSSDMLAIWHTAVTYQVMHALGMFVIALLIPRLGQPLLGMAGAVMLGGIVIFSGSLYALALSGIRVLGAITPIGGVAFLVAWAMVAWAAYRAS